MSELADCLADCLAKGLDVALLPVWGWGPNLGRGHMDPERAAEALTLLRPRIAIPIHWGTFYPRWLGWLRPHLLTEPPQIFREEAAKRMPEVDIQILAPGSTLDLSRGKEGIRP
jgi:L-ascorbate metabolism protein UlaG (beta-lactamase superfamily)